VRVAGIDIGSCTTKLVVIEDGEAVEWSLLPTGADPLKAVRALIGDRTFERIAATGYGRKLAVGSVAGGALTEVKAAATGAHALSPECRTVIDIGGQDVKVIALDGNGGFTDFAMNDRCAAGTGRFLEVMARTLGFDLEQFGHISAGTEGSLRLSSMCAVFAESEVISLIARGEDPRVIARAVHEAVADRISALARTIAARSDTTMLAGGVARNACMVRLLEAKLGVPLIVHERAQYVAALGTALAANQ